MGSLLPLQSTTQIQGGRGEREREREREKNALLGWKYEKLSTEQLKYELLSLANCTYNTDFLIVKFDVLVCSYAQITKILTKMYHHPPFSLENYICDVRKMQRCIIGNKTLDWRVASMQV